MNLLILNGDATSNRGDRAILLGNITLLKKTFPEDEISAFSYNPKRDSTWYPIKFYDRGSLKEQYKAIKNANLICWGGGELIQDDTSKVKIPYWFVHIMVLSVIFRKKIIGLGQGLGPVRSKLNRFLSKVLLNRLSVFLSRDNYSEKMMRDMGVKIPVINSYDPAILVSDIIDKDKNKIRTYLAKNGFSVDSTDKIVGVGVRRWFHQRSSWIPHKYAVKYKLRKVPGDKEFAEMKKNLAVILDDLVSQGYKVVFFPMYTPSHEADNKVSRQILDLMKDKTAGFVIDEDISPTDYLELIVGTDLFFGVRLHSTILSTSVGIPSLTFYYVPKGKSYFEQLGISENAFQVEDLLLEEKTKKSLIQFNIVIKNNLQYAEKINKRIGEMKTKLIQDAQLLKDNI